MVSFPLPWPVRTPVLLKSIVLKDGMLEIINEPTGQLRVRIGNTEKSTEVLTSFLRISELVFNSLFVTWTGSHIEIKFADELIGANFDISRVPPEVTPKPYSEGKGQDYDFTQENVAAQADRKSRYRGWRGGSAPKASRIRGDKDYAFAALRGELNQINDLLFWIRLGNNYHIPGLAARIRMTISRGKPLPLLQLCAAMTDRQLIVYTASDPRKVRFTLPKDIEAPSHRLITAVSALPHPVFRNPIDLDVWLDLPAGQIGSEVLTSRQVLKKIGDTRGAHIDLDIYPTVAALRSGASELSGIKQADLETYLLRVAEIVASLSRQVLAN
jgi:hypothetical protein